MDKTIRLFIVLEELKRCYIKHVNNREVVSCIQQLVDGYFEICDMTSSNLFCSQMATSCKLLRKCRRSFWISNGMVFG